jgi:hypothetical protein
MKLQRIGRRASVWLALIVFLAVAAVAQASESEEEEDGTVCCVVFLRFVCTCVEPK